MFVAANATRKPLLLVNPTLVVTAELYPTITLLNWITLVSYPPAACPNTWPVIRRLVVPRLLLAPARSDASPKVTTTLLL